MVLINFNKAYASLEKSFQYHSQGRHLESASVLHDEGLNFSSLALYLGAQKRKLTNIPLEKKLSDSIGAAFIKNVARDGVFDSYRIQKLLEKRAFKKILSGKWSLTSAEESFYVGSVFYLQKKFKGSLFYFQKCLDEYDEENMKFKCTLGVARAYFAIGNYIKAELTYLDIEKKSILWPHILYEESWVSFYKKDYNRTLGKLATYDSPFLREYYRPEYFVLKAYSYLELCQWGDLKKIIKAFDRIYSREKSILKSVSNTRSEFNSAKGIFLPYLWKGKNFKMILENKEKIRSEISFLKSKLRKQSGHEAKFSRKILKALYDFEKIRKRVSLKKIKDFSKSRLKELNQSYKYMRYMKLEALKYRKERLYRNVKGKKRGSIKFLKRNEKQYFWPFHKEFWLDELGDFIYALENKCSKS